MKSILLVCLLAVAVNVSAQAEKDVKSTLEKLFVAMGTADSAGAAKLFYDKARLSSIYNRNGKVVVEEEKIAEFIHQIASKKAEETYDERISSYEIKIDGEMATAWTPYEFYYNGKFSHCGVNAFQLAKLDGEWKIVQITDTRRKSCK